MYTLIIWKEDGGFVNIYLLRWRRLENKLTRTSNRRHPISTEKITRTNYKQKS